MNLFLKYLIFTVFALQIQLVIADININTEYYTVEGKNAEDLIQQLSQKGINGYAGYTKWDIKTNYQYKINSNNCHLTNYNIDLKVVFTMPKWIDKSTANRKLQLKWNNWYKSLLAHEKNHASHGEKAYIEIEQQFSKLPRKDNCQELETSLNMFTDNIISKYIKKDKRYDKLTNHGETEGASSTTLK